MSSTPPISLMTFVPDQEFIKPDFVENVGDKYNCVKCSSFLKPPVKQLQCGHRICEACYSRTVQEDSHPKCPGNDEDCIETNLTNPDHVFPDFGVLREMKNAKVYCANKEFGCKDIMNWSQLTNHTNSCKYKPMECSNRELGCPFRAPMDSMNRHKTECEYNPVRCEYCDCDVPEKEMKEGHRERCQDRPKPCEFKEELGCTFTSKNMEALRSHQHIEHREHIKAILKQMKTLKEQGVNLGQRIGQAENQQQQQLQALETKLDGKTLEMSNMVKTASKEQRERLKHVTKLTGTNSEKIEQLLRENKTLQEINKIYERRIQDLEMGNNTNRSRGSPGMSDEATHQLVNLNKTVGSFGARFAEQELRMQCLETASYNGTLIWKITDYQRRKSEAIQGKTLSLYSQPFYSSKFGYKMCCRVYLNGDGMGKGKNLSVFFVIMKGDFDDLLPWPFRQKVTLTLLDVENGRRNATDTFRPDPTSSSFKKPTAEMNVASGCPLFATHTVVESPTHLKNDTIYLKVSIDTADLSLP